MRRSKRGHGYDPFSLREIEVVPSLVARRNSKKFADARAPPMRSVRALVRFSRSLQIRHPVEVCRALLPFAKLLSAGGSDQP